MTNALISQKVHSLQLRAHLLLRNLSRLVQLNCMEKLSCSECVRYNVLLVVICRMHKAIYFFDQYCHIIYCQCLIRGVDILKRPARAGERPWDCLKGTSVVCVPVHYVLAYINSLEYRGDWDDLFLKGIFFQRTNFMGCLKLECEGAPFYLSYNPDVLILLKLVTLSASSCMSPVTGLAQLLGLAQSTRMKFGKHDPKGKAYNYVQVVLSNVPWNLSIRTLIIRTPL